MDALAIDSMRLQLPGLSPDEGRRLALEVSRELSQNCQQLAPREISALNINVRAGGIADITELARQIAAEIVREIQRLP